MKANSTNVVQVSQQSEKTSTQLVVPDFNAIVVSATNYEGLRLMEVYTSHGAVVLVETVKESTHPVVP
jgi:hypothetical protein